MMKHTRKSPNQLTLWLGVFLLLVAAFARITSLNEAPPALQHDEIFKAQEGIALIENGYFRLFYPSNQGHEGFFVWILGVSYALFGQNLLMVKFPALVFGLLTVALMYRVNGMIFNRRVAFIAAGLTAVSFWAIFTSRVGLRAVTLPPFTLLVIGGLHALTMQKPRWWTAVITGIAGGLLIYTYTSAFAVYVAAAVWGVALLLFARQALRRSWRHLLLAGVIAFLMVTPMIIIRVTDPQGQNRVSTITRPLNDALNGQPTELIDNAVKLMGMPAFTGDPEWRYNVAERPLFVLPIGLLVYAGLLIALWKTRRKPILALFITLSIAGLVPSLLTVSAPSFLRSIVVLPSVMLFIALAVDMLPRKTWVWGLGTVAIFTTAAFDWHAYFNVWIQEPEVHRIYRDDIEQLAAYLRETDAETLLVSTDDVTLDPGILPYYLPPENRERDIARTIFFDGETNIALARGNAQLLISPQSPITPPHVDWLSTANGAQAIEPLETQNGLKAYDIYDLSGIDAALVQRLEQVQETPLYIDAESAFQRGAVREWAAPVQYPVNFGNVVQLVGVDLPRKQINSQRDGVNIQLYFQPLTDTIDTPLNVYVHMSRLDGTVHAQRDFLGVPTVEWQTGITFIQDNFVIAGDTPPGRYIITMGVYNRLTGERLPVVDVYNNRIADRIIIDRIRVTDQNE